MKQVLLVDDDEALRRVLSEMLRRAGYAVRVAEDGDVALKMLRQGPVDLVITDLIMPNKEGLETIRELRQIQPGLKILAISGGGRMPPDVYLLLAGHLGANQTLTKPFSSSKLLETVANLLDAPGPSSA